MTQAEVADIVAISQITPGPFAVNAATFAGVKTGSILGGVVATAAVVLPSLIIATLLARYFFKFEDNVIVRRAMWGLRPVVTGLIAAAAGSMALSALLGAESVAAIEWASLFSAMDIPSVVIVLVSGLPSSNQKSPVLVILARRAGRHIAWRYRDIVLSENRAFRQDKTAWLAGGFVSHCISQRTGWPVAANTCLPFQLAVVDVKPAAAALFIVDFVFDSRVRGSPPRIYNAPGFCR